MLDQFIAKNAIAHKVNSYYKLAISYCTLCVGKHTILGSVKNADNSRFAPITLLPFLALAFFAITPPARHTGRGVDPYGTGGARPTNIWTGGHYHECPPQYF